MGMNQPNSSTRYVNPQDIFVIPGYTIDVFSQGLNAPVNMAFDNEGNILVAESGKINGNARIMRLTPNGYEVVAENFNIPLTGVNYFNGDIYASHSGSITVIKADGTRQNLIIGLPSSGDYKNNQIAFGNDGKMYFGQGSATNSGVVGLDNTWAVLHPYFHDFPAEDIRLLGQNYVSYNFLSLAPYDYAFTGAYRSFGLPNRPNVIISGSVRPTGCIYRANLDGSELEVFAWGLREPFALNFDQYDRLFVANHGYDNRGSRPINNAYDEFQLINQGEWYGFPDYNAGMLVSNPVFRPEAGPVPQLLLAEQPSVPPMPFAVTEPHSSMDGFDFNYDDNFGPYGDVYMAQFGSQFPTPTGGYPLPAVGRRVIKIDMNDGSLSTFAINKSGLGASFTGSGGFERPIDVVFGPDKAMYVLDYGIANPNNPNLYLPNTGVIWRISR